MNIKNRMLPYPVQGIGEDIMPLPSLGPINNGKEGKEYFFEWEVHTKNEKILSLVDSGQAEYVCEVDCPRTFFRKCFKQKSPIFRIKIHEDFISARIDFEVTIVVKDKIRGYTNEGFHEDYLEYTFDLESGDLLSYIGSFYYDVDIQYEKLQAVGSFMQIEKSNDGDTTTSVSLDNDKISIRLPQPMFDDYNKLSIGKKRASIIHSSLVFNALLQALYNYEEFHDRLWAKTIKYRIEQEENLSPYRNDVDDDAPFDKTIVYKLAQALLGDPYQRLFNCLEDLTNSVEED